MNIADRIELHKKFWNGEVLNQLLVSFRIGNYFFADKFKAGENLLKPGLKLEPQLICVDDFLKDYERMYNEVEQTGQSGFWTVEPYIGIPWIEAILGCSIFAREKSFVTEPVKK